MGLMSSKSAVVLVWWPTLYPRIQLYLISVLLPWDYSGFISQHFCNKLASLSLSSQLEFYFCFLFAFMTHNPDQSMQLGVVWEKVIWNLGKQG